MAISYAGDLVPRHQGNAFVRADDEIADSFASLECPARTDNPGFAVTPDKMERFSRAALAANLWHSAFGTSTVIRIAISCQLYGSNWISLSVFVERSQSTQQNG